MIWIIILMIVILVNLYSDRFNFLKWYTVHYLFVMSQLGEV